jgi:hypothetical protein
MDKTTYKYLEDKGLRFDIIISIMSYNPEEHILELKKLDKKFSGLNFEKTLIQQFENNAKNNYLSIQKLKVYGLFQTNNEDQVKIVVKNTSVEDYLKLPFAIRNEPMIRKYALKYGHVKYMYEKNKNSVQLAIDALNAFQNNINYVPEHLKKHPAIISTIENKENVLIFISPENSKDEEFMRSVMKRVPGYFRGADADLRSNKEFVEFALKLDMKNLEYALHIDEDFIIDLLDNCPKNQISDDILPKEVQSNKHLMLKIVERNPCQYENLSVEIKKDQEFIKIIIQDQYFIKDLPEYVRGDKELVLGMLEDENCGIIMNYISQSLREDESFNIEILEKYNEKIDVTRYINVSLLMNSAPKILLQYYKISSNIFHSLFTSKEQCMQLLKKNPEIYYSFPKEFQEDIDLIYKFISIKKSLTADEALKIMKLQKGNRKLIMKLLKAMDDENIGTFCYYISDGDSDSIFDVIIKNLPEKIWHHLWKKTSISFRSNIKRARKMIEKNPMIIYETDNFLGNQYLIRKCITLCIKTGFRTYNALMLKFPSMKTDYAIAKLALMKDPDNYRVLDKELTKSIPLMRNYIKVYPEKFKYISTKCQNNHQILKIAILKHAPNMEVVSSKLRTNRAFVESLLKKNLKILNHLEKDLYFELYSK